MPTGAITKWIDDRGFGFLDDDDKPNGRGTFVHISALREAPEIGDVLEYEIATGLDGRPRATNVRPVTAAREEADRVFGR